MRQRAFHIGLAESQPGLAQELRDGAQNCDVTPGKLGRHHQFVEAVGFGLARPNRVERILQQRFQALELDRFAVGSPHQEVLQGGLLRLSVFGKWAQRESIFGDDFETEIFEHR